MSFPDIGGTSGSVQTTTSYPAGAGAAKVNSAAPAPQQQGARALPTQASPQTTAPVDAKQLDEAVKKLQEAAASSVAANNLNFSVDKDTGKTVVRVIDQVTGNTIRQIPSQEAIEIAKSVDRLQGLLLRESA